MKKGTFKITTPLVICCFFTLILSCSDNRVRKIKEKVEQTYPENVGLNPKAPEQTRQFGQLSGLWKCISEDLVKAPDGSYTWYKNNATWKWEYVLGGHAVLNQWWQEDTSPNPPTKEYFATGIFIYNPKTTLWEIVVLNSRPHKISPKFQATYKDNEIHMHDGTDTWMVTFYEIKTNSFKWKYEVIDSIGNRKVISRISAQREALLAYNDCAVR